MLEGPQGDAAAQALARALGRVLRGPWALAGAGVGGDGGCSGDAGGSARCELGGAGLARVGGAVIAEGPALRVVEQMLVPAAVPPSRGADRLILGPKFYGVVDGSTSKPWNYPQSPDGAAVADVVARELTLGDGDVSATAAVERLTAAVAELLGDSCGPWGPSATFAVYSSHRRELWRVGDPWLCVDGVVHPPRPTAELQVARRRADLLRSLLGAGAMVEELMGSDPGRKAILDDLRALEAARNSPDGNGQGAVTGRPIPAHYVEVEKVGSAVKGVSLATDGYPIMGATLAIAEEALRKRLALDPLLIGEPPMTKGVRPGMASFDDRAYLRLEFP